MNRKVADWEVWADRHHGGILAACRWFTRAVLHVAAACVIVAVLVRLLGVGE